MDQLFISEDVGQNILEWAKFNVSELVDSGLLHKNVPIPFKEIMFRMECEEYEDIVELIIKGDTFKNMNLSLLGTRKNKIIDIQVDDLDFVFDEPNNRYLYKVTETIDHNLDIDDDLIMKANEPSITMIYNIIFYILYHKEDVQIEKTVKTHDKHSPKKSQKKRRVYIERHYKLIGTDKYVGSGRNKHYSKESWNVRGHVRRFKNGKVTYVKPYTKGKGKKRDTEYKL